MITEEIINAYAIELAKRPNDPLAAAIKCTGGDVGWSLELMSKCREDPGFGDRQRDLIEASGIDAFLPSKELIGYEILSVGRNDKVSSDIRLKAYRLYCDMQGYIAKDIPPNVQVNVQQNRVMVVTRHTNLDEWENTAQSQQTKLIENASAPTK